jgi:hypothetical protein
MGYPYIGIGDNDNMAIKFFQLVVTHFCSCVFVLLQSFVLDYCDFVASLILCFHYFFFFILCIPILLVQVGGNEDRTRILVGGKEDRKLSDASCMYIILVDGPNRQSYYLF